MAKRKKKQPTKHELRPFDAAAHKAKLKQKAKDIASGKRRPGCIAVPPVSKLVEDAVRKIEKEKEEALEAVKKDAAKKKKKKE